MKKKLQTIADILRADDVRAVLSDLDAEAGSIETIVAVVRNTEGYVYCRYFASVPEALGLLTIGQQLISREISGEELQ